MKKKTILFTFIATLFVASCCKKKPDVECIGGEQKIQPFIERFSDFWCLGNNEYTYILRTKDEIDSLADCNFSPPVPFPVDEESFVYLMVGRMSYHYRDTFQTSLLKDTCNKRLIYDVKMIQTDTAYNCCPYGTGGVLSMFCSVENIPADYEVEVKYTYVPLP